MIDEMVRGFDRCLDRVADYVPPWLAVFWLAVAIDVAVILAL